MSCEHRPHRHDVQYLVARIKMMRHLSVLVVWLAVAARHTSSLQTRPVRSFASVAKAQRRTHTHNVAVVAPSRARSGITMSSSLVDQTAKTGSWCAAFALALVVGSGPALAEADGGASEGANAKIMNGGASTIVNQVRRGGGAGWGGVDVRVVVDVE